MKIARIVDSPHAVYQFDWSPIRGCKEECKYCLTRKNFVQEKGHFNPEFLPDVLEKIDRYHPHPEQGPASGNVACCTWGEAFGPWVPREWIEAVISKVRKNSRWEFLFSTRYPWRMTEFEWPENVWLGTTVDRQGKVADAEEAFSRLPGHLLKYVSLAPLLEPIKFSRPELFSWFFISGLKYSFPLVKALADPIVEQARSVGAAVFLDWGWHLDASWDHESNPVAREIPVRNGRT